MRWDEKFLATSFEADIVIYMSNAVTYTITTRKGSVLEGNLLSVTDTHSRFFVGGTAPFRTFRNSEIVAMKVAS